MNPHRELKFDTMSSLIDADPAEFYDWRAKLIDMTIDKGFAPDHMTELQNQIDVTQAISGSGHASLVAIRNLLDEYLTVLKQSVEHWSSILEDLGYANSDSSRATCALEQAEAHRTNLDQIVRDILVIQEKLKAIA